MNQTRYDIALSLLNDYIPSLLSEYSAFAPINIALCKYWGKRNSSLNLPTNDSLSISLGDKGTQTTLRLSDEEKKDTIVLNGQTVPFSSNFYQKATAHIDLFRFCFGPQTFHVETTNNVATAAGLASSASGFAALTKALSGIYGLNLPTKTLSILARLGSGSACRSLFTGFSRWHKGIDENGLDSYATEITQQWPELRIGILNISSSKKTVGSREGMLRTVKTCILYQQWPIQAEKDITLLEEAISTKDFNLLGCTSEHNAMTMHGTMLSSWPPLFYWTPETLRQAHKIWGLREKGLQIYMTMDAGPNIKLLFESDNESSVRKIFPEADIIYPFPRYTSLQN